jgi:protein-tyrosine phosphatase
MTLDADSRVALTLHLLPTQGNCGDSTMSKFQIYSLPLDGGTIGIAPMPDMSDDETRAVVRDFAPSVVISMTQDQEFPDADVDRFKNAVEVLGARWFHMPIKDFGAPTGLEEQPWPAIAHACKNTITAGRSVLFHCKGGHGRSGMAAIRLMVEMGADPQDALKLLRSQRPSAVETVAQFDWAAKGKW